MRVVVVGQRVFATRINSQHSPAAQVDFRAAYSDLTYEVYQLPQEGSNRVIVDARIRGGGEENG